jgi:hypothetical protein
VQAAVNAAAAYTQQTTNTAVQMIIGNVMQGIG